jgi:hypothetical protein
VSIGVALGALKRPEKKVSSYQAALQIREKLVNANSDNAEWKRALSWAYFWFGDHYFDEQLLDKAVDNLRPCMRLRLELVRANPGTLRPDPIWRGRIMNLAWYSWERENHAAQGTRRHRRNKYKMAQGPRALT